MAETKLRFGEILVRAGLLSETHLKAALAEQKKWGGRLGRVLVDMALVDEPTIVAALAHHLNLSAIDLEASPPPADAARLLAVQECERYGVFPISLDRETKVLRLATSDPTNFHSLAELEFRTGLKIEPVVAGTSDIDRTIRRIYYGETPARPSHVPTAAPLAEPTFEAEPYQPPTPPVLTPTLTVTTQPPGSPAAELALIERIERLEDLLSRQARALRALVEVLIERGQVDREDYIRRVRGNEP